MVRLIRLHEFRSIALARLESFLCTPRRLSDVERCGIDEPHAVSPIRKPCCVMPRPTADIEDGSRWGTHELLKQLLGSDELDERGSCGQAVFLDPRLVVAPDFLIHVRDCDGAARGGVSST